MPKVTVIIPAFNSAPFVGRAIHSVLQQTFQDLELIVVDDGSTDETSHEVKSFSDRRISYVFQPNQGPNAARNHGINRAKGELLAFLDSDDWWLPRKLEVQLSRLSSVLEAGLVYCSTLKVDEEGRLLKFRPALLEGWVLPRLIMSNHIAAPSSVLIPRRVLDEVGLFDEQLWRAEDWEMWLRIAAAFPLAAVKDPLACITYRRYGHGRNVPALRDDSLVVLEKAFGSYAAHMRHLRAKAFARVHLRAGISFATSGQLRESRGELIKALQMDPSLLEAYWRVGLTFLGSTINSRGRQAKEIIRLRMIRSRRIGAEVIPGIDEGAVKDA
jgi:glycosyltransferase involved in cell wall biosynthesis